MHACMYIYTNQMIPFSRCGTMQKIPAIVMTNPINPIDMYIIIHYYTGLFKITSPFSK